MGFVTGVIFSAAELYCSYPPLHVLSLRARAVQNNITIVFHLGISKMSGSCTVRNVIKLDHADPLGFMLPYWKRQIFYWDIPSPSRSGKPCSVVFEQKHVYLLGWEHYPSNVWKGWLLRVTTRLQGLTFINSCSTCCVEVIMAFMFHISSSIIA